VKQCVSLSKAGKELLYLRIIMREFGFPQLWPSHLREDSRAVVAITENPSQRNGAYHTDTEYMGKKGE